MKRPLKSRPPLRRWSPALAARSSRLAIARIERELAAIAGYWADVDMSVEFECDQLRGPLEELKQCVDDAHRAQAGTEVTADD